MNATSLHRIACSGLALAVQSACGDDGGGSAQGDSTTEAESSATETMNPTTSEASADGDSSHGSTEGSTDSAGPDDSTDGGSSNGSTDGGSSDTSGSSDSGDSSDSGGSSGSTGEPAACNLLLNDGEPIDVISIDEDVPAPEGGVIEDGFYVLTALAFYTGPGGETGPTGVQMQSEWTLEDDALEYVQLDSTGVELRISATVTIDEPELVAAGICPDMSEYVIPYTATETTVLFVYPDNVWTYTRQP